MIVFSEGVRIDVRHNDMSSIRFHQLAITYIESNMLILTTQLFP